MSHQVYQVLNISGTGAEELMALSSLNMSEPEAGAGQTAASWPGQKWLIQSRNDDGLNIYYQLCIVYPRGREFQLTLPWLAQETCPNCQGQGVVYRWNKNSSTYDAAECDDCHGEGAYSYDSDISITINDGLGGQRVIRKSRAGHFDARLGLRGDLILNITWVDQIPPAEEAAPASNIGH
jgi:hypothetical protein